jgi:DNA-binding NarL/FixJ family response regulator
MLFTSHGIPLEWAAMHHPAAQAGLTSTGESAIMRVLLASNQEGLRSALRLVLDHEPGMALAGEATDAAGLLDCVAACQPDLLLLDWELPELKAEGAGRRLCSALFQSHPALCIIALSGRPEQSRRALAAGALLVVSKAEPAEKLLAALHTVHRTLDHGGGSSGLVD